MEMAGSDTNNNNYVTGSVLLWAAYTIPTRDTSRVSVALAYISIHTH